MFCINVFISNVFSYGIGVDRSLGAVCSDRCFGDWSTALICYSQAMKRFYNVPLNGFPAPWSAFRFDLLRLKWICLPH